MIIQAREWPAKTEVIIMSASDPDPLEVGARIRALRHEAGISQSGLAKIIGVSPGAVGNWEQGQSYPTIKQGMKICRSLGVVLDYLYRGRINEMAKGRGETLAKLERLKHDPTGPNLGLHRH